MRPTNSFPSNNTWRWRFSSLHAMAAHRVRVWWRRGGRECAIAAAGFGTLILALLLTVGPLLRDGGGLLGSFFRDPALVDLTLLQDAEQKGAVCLDGSPPGYHFQRGSGSGSSSWIIHLEGGGWCNTIASCAKREMTALGSSTYMSHQVAFEGILSNEQSQNPDFFNWNKVKIRYCDGASLSGYIESEIQNGTKLLFRGQMIWKAIINELLMKGLADAKQALLTGCSAGGLATFIYCDNFRALLPEDATVKCFADGGYFLDSKDISGARTIKSFYENVVHLQDVGKDLQKDCISRKEPTECFFPQEMVKYISTPFFVLNSAYDWWQIQNILVPKESDPSQQWQRCKKNIHNCDPKQIEILHGFRETLLNALRDFQRKQGMGIFVDSCYTHCQTMSSSTWHSPDSPRINSKTIAEAVGDWYFGRETVNLIDCLYPCNPTCHHHEFP